MTTLPQLILLGFESAACTRVRELLVDIANVAAAADTPEASLTMAKNLAPATVLVGAQVFDRSWAEVVRHATSVGCPVIVVGATKDPELLLTALRAGAREFVLREDAESLRRVVREQAAQIPNTRIRAKGTVLAVYPTKGGAGSTVVAINLANTLRLRNQRTCLVDLDTYLGDCLTYLDLDAGYSISDVLANIPRLDDELLDASLVRHRSGLHVLAPSVKLEEAEQIRPADVTSLLSFLALHYDAVVVDGIRGFSDLSLAALDLADQVFLLVTQDIPALRNARRALTLFARLGYNAKKLRLVVNRYGKRSALTEKLIADDLGLPVTARVANDFPVILQAINRGLLLADVAPRGRVAKDMNALADLILERREEHRKPLWSSIPFVGTFLKPQRTKHEPQRTSTAL